MVEYDHVNLLQNTYEHASLRLNVEYNYVQAASNYLLRVAREGERVGIVWFKEAASIQVNLTQINNVTRRELLQHVPRGAAGGTAIGDGE